MIPKYTHIVLSGGGLSGIVYIGIYRLLKQYEVIKNVRYITGTSIGAFFAFIFCLDIDYEYIEEIFASSLCVDNPIVEFNPNNIFQLCSKNGMFRTEKFRNSIVKILKNKHNIEDITFSEYIRLTGIDIHIQTTCLNTYSSIDLCNDTFPEMSVITAVLASMSIPFIFEPVIYKEMVLVDGGCCANMNIYDILQCNYNKVLQIYLSTERIFTESELTGDFFAYTTAVMLTMLSSHTKKLVNENKDKFDILEITKSPLSFAKADFRDNIIYTTLKKSELDESIIFGYVELHQFFSSKGYLEQTLQEPPSYVPNQKQ